MMMICNILVTIKIRYIINRPAFYLENKVSETRVCPRLQEKRSQFSKIDGSSFGQPTTISSTALFTGCRESRLYA
jgi:hypothetical protein